VLFDGLLIEADELADLFRGETFAEMQKAHRNLFDGPGGK